MDEKKINILGLNNLSGAELLMMMLENVKKKSSVNIRNEINTLSTLFLTGQVIIFDGWSKYFMTNI